MQIRFGTKTKSLLITLLCILASCASQELRVESNPDGADVIVIDQSKVSKKVGVTPLLLNSSNVPGLYQYSMQINVVKDGYKSQSVFVPETTVPASGQLVVQLYKDEAGFVGSATGIVAQVQRIIFKKNYIEAERMLLESISKNPSVAVFHSLLGNVYYLQKNTQRALDSYQRAQAIEPNNIEVINMIQKLKGMRVPEESR